MSVTRVRAQRVCAEMVHAFCMCISRLSLSWTHLKILTIKHLNNQTYRIYSAVSRDPKLWTCRLGITRTKNKLKTPSYKPRPIHYYKTELLITGKPNIFGKKSHWYNLAFKLKTVAEAEAVENNSEIAREYGISETMVHHWRKDQANLSNGEIEARSKNTGMVYRAEKPR